MTILSNIKTRRPILFHKGVHIKTLKYLSQMIERSLNNVPKKIKHVKSNQTFRDGNFALNFPWKVVKKELCAD